MVDVEKGNPMERCLRVLHLELVSDLTADRFLLSLRRFMSLYGTPKNLINDNGSNFVGAAREITRMLNSWRREMKQDSPVMKVCEIKLITWKFSTHKASIIMVLWKAW